MADERRRKNEKSFSAVFVLKNGKDVFDGIDISEKNIFVRPVIVVKLDGEKIAENGNTIISEFRDSITSKSEKKKYAFTIEQDGVIWFEYNHEYINDERLYWSFTLYNSDDTPMTEINIFGNSTESVESRKIGLKSGDYYILMSSGYAYSDKKYHIIVKFDNSSLWENEFNDIRNISNMILINTDIYGSIMAKSDVDWYSFKLEKPGRVILDFGNMKDKAKNYWDAYIYNDTEKELCVGHFNGNVFGYEHSETMSLDAGKYYVKVTSGDKFSVYPYFFKINFTEK